MKPQQKQRPKSTARLNPRIVRLINKYVTNKPEDIIFIGRQLRLIFGAHFPKSHWKETGIKLPYTEAAAIRALSEDPYMTDPRNMKHFPSDRGTIIALWEFLQSCIREGNPKLFLQKIKDGTINPDIRRNQVRDLKKFGGMSIPQIRTFRKREALADKTAQTGHDIHTGDFRLLYDLVGPEEAAMCFCDPPWQKKDVNLFGPMAKLVAEKLKRSGYCLALCGDDVLKEAMRQMDEHLIFRRIFTLVYTGNTMKRYATNEWCHGQHILVYQKATETIKCPRMVMNARVNSSKAEKSYHESF
jgi:hypothetical protein